MKKYTPLLLFAIVLAGCAAPKPVALKGSYRSTPMIIETDRTFDQVWDKLIDLFAQKGLSIKVIDRSSGLIVSERAILTSTTEFNSGLLKDSTAFIVAPKEYNRYTKKYDPVYRRISGEWNVRIKRVDDKTLINVNLVNITAQRFTIDDLQKPIYADGPCQDCKSTGFFEQTLSNLIK